MRENIFPFLTLISSANLTGKELRMQLENGIALTKNGVFYLDQRQTKFHIVK